MREHPAPLLIAACLALLAAAGACGGSNAAATDGGPDVAPGPDGGALICAVQPPTSCPDPPVHYSDVVPVIQARCLPCHDGVVDGGPWPLTDYQHNADWAFPIRDELVNCTMPPADGGVTISDEERQAILTWIRCGYPE